MSYKTVSYKKGAPEEPAGEAMISHAKAAEMCGVTREAILSLIRRGRLGSVEVEGRTLLSRREVEAFERSELRADSPDGEPEGVGPERIGRV